MASPPSASAAAVPARRQTPAMVPARGPPCKRLVGPRSLFLPGPPPRPHRGLEARERLPALPASAKRASDCPPAAELGLVRFSSRGASSTVGCLQQSAGRGVLARGVTRARVPLVP